MRTRIIAGITAGVLTLGLGMASIGTANAAPLGHAGKGTVTPDTSGKFTNFVTTDNTNIRSGPGLGYPVVGHVALTTQGIADYCYTTGNNNPSGSPFWDLVFDPYNNIGGFVSESVLRDGSQTLHC
jgi:hypothetical protein